jgi:hypothetical protein
MIKVAENTNFGDACKRDAAGCDRVAQIDGEKECLPWLTPKHIARALSLFVAFGRADNGQLAPAYDPMLFGTPRRHSYGALSRGNLRWRFSLESCSATCYR